MATVFFLLVMAAAGYWVYMEALDGGQHVTVPDIVGLPSTEASHVLAEQGLELGKPTQTPDKRVPKYHIIAQRPPSGRVVRTGRKVYPTVSMGSEFLNAPDLLRKSLEDARREVTQTRFRVGSVARIPHKTPRDTVIAQDPAPGRKIPNQGSISLLVSGGTGESSAFMPDIRGMAVPEVLRILAPYGVTVVPNEVDYPGAREDVVLDQDPSPDTLIYEGQVVVYDVKPSGAVQLPDTRYQVEVLHRFPYDWYARDVRVDVVDRRGNRQNALSKGPRFDEASRAKYVAGSTIRIPVTYIGEASVEIHVDEECVETYLLSQGADPVKKSARPR